MKTKITADSTCDLSKELIEKYNIRIIPLHIINADNVDYLDGIDIKPNDIFDYVDRENKTCHTAAINIEELETVFKEELAENDAVVHISISSDFSACYQNACIAAEVGNVYVIDSRNLSTGGGLVVLDAARMAQEGVDPAEIKARLDEKTEKVEASFVIDTLKYLHKGGRCSALVALGANVLSLKPCIEVKGGKMVVGKKYRGSFDKAIRNYVKDRLINRDDIDYSRVFITHCMCSDELVSAVREIVEDLGQFEEILITDAGCTVSNHCGPNTLGILFYRK
ncbi:MAG: DegV family protein [Clostridiales bacterium]|nr:DegV family protein [Clostridiales bacterium]